MSIVKYWDFDCGMGFVTVYLGSDHADGYRAVPYQKRRFLVQH
jgi:hypothetical protein